jgi:hypothetical protein
MGSSPAARAGVIPDAVVAVAVVLPARMVDDRVEADAADRDAGRDGREHLALDHAKPRSAEMVLRTGLGDHDRSTVPAMQLGELSGERHSVGMVDRQGTGSVDPLVVGVVVHADDVEMRLRAAELGLPPPGEEVPRLELRRGRVRRVRPLMRARGVRGHVDERLGMEEPDPWERRPKRIDARDRRRREPRLQLGPACRGERVHHADVASGPR